MQLIEVSEIGVRASLVRLKSNRAQLEWVMFPMIHLGERAYYKEVEERLARCDLVLAEGVDSAIVGALTAAYRAGVHGSDVVAQPLFDESPATGHLAVENADVSGEQFNAAWRRMPLGLRIGVPILAPLVGLWLRYVANPEQWHPALQTDDLPTNEEVLVEGQMPELFDLLLNRRNQHLFHQIDQVQNRWASEARTVGVAWGARHIGAVAGYLSDRWDYFSASADWITVFDYTK